MDTRWVSVKVHPCAGKETCIQHGPSRFEVWVKAKPVEGRANAAVIRLMAAALGVAPGRLRLVRGGEGRHKLLHIRDA
jgi:uncharacterized protein YggU (UPF0235/DUF167 family)